MHRGSPHCRPGFETVLQYSTMNSQNDLRSAGSQSRNYSSVAIMVSRHLILFSQSIHALFLVVADQNVNRKVKESIRLETNPHERSLSHTNQHLVYQRPYPSPRSPNRFVEFEEYSSLGVTSPSSLTLLESDSSEAQQPQANRIGKRNRRSTQLQQPSNSPNSEHSSINPSQESTVTATDKPSIIQPSDVPTFVPTWSPVPLLRAPLKVFVIAGQSNAIGKGSIQHLNDLVSQKCNGGCNEYRRALWDSHTNFYRVNSNVYEKSLNYTGPLEVYDDYDDHSTNESDNFTFGPDLMFGWTVQEALGEPIAIIKTAWEGRSLAVDFRPPSSGLGNFTDVDPSDYGAYYRMMLLEISNSLDDLKTWVPCYNPSEGHELAGFVWFQGWNDMLNWKSVSEYADNLANLMRDLRYHLQVERLPFVVGELGMHGNDEGLLPADAYSRIMKMRSSQYLVTTMDEFKDDALFVRTSPYVVLDGEQFNGVYHYGGRADTFFHIGQAFGRGMMTLLGQNISESDECVCEPSNRDGRV